MYLCFREGDFFSDGGELGSRPRSSSSRSSGESSSSGTDKKPCAATAEPGFPTAARISCSVSSGPGKPNQFWDPRRCEKMKGRLNFE